MKKTTAGILLALLITAAATGAWAALDKVEVVRPAGSDDYYLHHSHAAFATTAGGSGPYSSVSGDLSTTTYAYGAGLNGGLERWGFTSGGVTTDFLNSNTYHSLSRIQNNPTTVIAARAGGVDKIAWDGSAWVTTTLTTNQYTQITSDAHTWCVYGIRADGAGVDRIMYNGDILRVTNLNFTTITGGVKTATANNANMLFGTLASGGVTRVMWNGSSFAATPMGAGTSIVYTSIVTDASGGWVYGARADGGLDRMNASGTTDPLNAFSYVALTRDAVWQHNVYGARADGGIDRVWWDATDTSQVIWYTDSIASGAYSALSYDASASGLVYAANVVPEPTALLALGTGLIGLAGTRLRRRK